MMQLGIVVAIGRGSSRTLTTFDLVLRQYFELNFVGILRREIGRVGCGSVVIVIVEKMGIYGE